MKRSFKHKQFEVNDKYTKNIYPLNIGYTPDITIVSQQSKSVRKISLRDLPQIENGSQLCYSQIKQQPSIPSLSESRSSKKAVEIVKEAQLQLFSSQNERANIKPKKVRALTIENQSGMDFTFAQNFFSNKDYIKKEFSAHSLKKRFFV